MAALLAQRCLHHPLREAVARCPECTQFFCRECVTEHDDRVVCSACLARLAVKQESKRRNLAPIWRMALATLGVLVAWMFFFVMGRILVSLPTDFHEGTLWKGEWLDRVEETP